MGQKLRWSAVALLAIEGQFRRVMRWPRADGSNRLLSVDDLKAECPVLEATPASAPRLDPDQMRSVIDRFRSYGQQP